MEDKMIYDKNGEIQLSLISTNKNRRTVLICLFKRQHKIHVDEFLTSQLKYYLDTRNSNDPKKWNIDLYHQYCATFNKLIQLKIFDSKHDLDSTWEMRTFDDCDPHGWYVEGESNNGKKYHIYDHQMILKNYHTKKFKILNYKREFIEDWCGERGSNTDHHNFGRFKIIVDQLTRQGYVFIENENDIELYLLGPTIAECYCEWDSKEFDWSKDNLIKLLPTEFKEDWFEKYL